MSEFRDPLDSGVAADERHSKAHSPARADLSTSPNLVEWHPQYMACLRHFVNYSQHVPFVQSVAAFINIRLPFQRRPDPVHHFNLSGSPPRKREEEKDKETGSPSNQKGVPQALQSRTGASSSSSSSSSFISLRQYIRRLVVTGHDSSSMLQTLFGDDWVAGVGSIRRQERVNYLFTAKSSGWASTKAAYDMLPDEHAPFLRPLVQPGEEEIRLAEAKWSEWLAMEDWMIGPRSPWSPW